MNDLTNVLPPIIPTLPDFLILEEILPRLPVKSLIRFKSVSKCWLSSISFPKFAKSHLKFSSSHSKFLILTENNREWKNEFFLLDYNENNCNVNEFVQLVFDNGCDDPITFMELVGSCHGLVCFYVRKDPKFFFVWNPATRCSRKIMIPVAHDKAMHYGCEFYYDPSHDEYMIFGSFSAPGDFYVHFHVFSLSSGIWKRISNLDKHFQLIVLGNTLLVDDTIYFCSFINNHIVGFDLVNEEIKELPSMNWLSRYYRARLLRLRGCLSLLCYTSDDLLDVWILNNSRDWNSWQKLFSFNCVNVMYHGFSETGKCLVHHGGQLKVVDPSCETLQFSREGINLNDDCIVQSKDYIESLVSPF
ncbi:F-box/kelch-repeat protein At3g23880-like [Chenopodium quinoa]|uniref:F-box/kelch-repeat protein At3g23880-like n=1 Tax=Chenopodium quinoa TaxID=63459 RepID=UPI000B77D1F3|nr:F-box/kelch-repeat protein At3g23880-like [Chenopodium quinoa]